MSELSELIYDELMRYHDYFNNEFISDLDLLQSNNINLVNYLHSRDRLILDTINININLKIVQFPILEKWDYNSNQNCNFVQNCIICLDNIYKGDEVYNLKCGTDTQLHIYHKICFEKWNRQSCPYCRTELV
jgi:hypothetical protein